MKRIFFMTVVLVVTLASCSDGKTKAGGGGDSATVDSATIDSTAEIKEKMKLTTNTFKFAKQDYSANVSVEIEYPVDGTPELCDAIQKKILSLAEHNFPGNKKSGQAVANYLGKSAYDNASAMWTEVDKENQEMAVEGTDMEYIQQPPYASTIEVKRLAETDNYVTFTISTYEYLGGAHGSSVMEGVTFSKFDGKEANHKIVKNHGPKGLNDIIKEGLERYFKESGAMVTGSDLEDLLLLENGKTIDNLPLPAMGLYVTPNGITFCYGQYEIAPYASGMPTFTVPFDQIKPYLTNTAIDLFEK